MDEVQIAGVLISLGFEVETTGRAEITKVCSFSEPIPHALTFWRHESSPPQDQLAELPTTSVILAEKEHREALKEAGVTAILVNSPRAAFAVISNELNATRAEPGIHPTAVLAPGASIDASASIGAHTFIGVASIGPRVQIGHGVIIHDNVHIGADVEVGDSTVIGGPGFGYVNIPNGTSMRMPHLGGVSIGEGVHIGSNVSIDRGTINHTCLEAHCRIDNLVHLAHNILVGAGTTILAGTVIGGSVRIGKSANIGPQASIREQITIGNYSRVGFGSVVIRNVDSDTTVMGFPARKIK
jgi:UDP-3-O-[3-hydroxymyristoyl] glucosamine N-acyltransferase